MVGGGALALLLRAALTARARPPRDAASIAFARHELRRIGGGLPARLLAELQLVVSELLTNALVHGQGAITLDVDVELHRVRGEVADEGGGFVPVALVRGSAESHGRGLAIVAALTTAWGVRPGDSRVWFELC